ncbi:MAG: uncharacterized protein JWQ53_2916 [Klenkia sp.]|nr:uncharacterized protein [Klenkia sp.]
MLLLAVPGPFWIRGTAALGGVLLGLVFSLAYMPETTEHRLVEAGHPAGTAVRTHEAAQRERQEAESVLRRAAATRRAQRYRDRHGR